MVRSQRAIAVVVSVALLGGCFPKKAAPPPPVVQQAPVAKPKEAPGAIPPPQARPSPVPQVDNRAEEARSELQSQVSQQQELIAALSADLEAQQAQIKDQQQLLAYQGNQQSALRQQQLNQIATQLLVSEQLLASRTIDLRNALGPVGDTWVNPIVDGLRDDVARLQAGTQELRNRQSALQQEQQQGLAENVAQQSAVLETGRARQAAIAEALSAAKSNLATLNHQLSTG